MFPSNFATFTAMNEILSRVNDPTKPQNEIEEVVITKKKSTSVTTEQPAEPERQTTFGENETPEVSLNSWLGTYTTPEEKVRIFPFADPITLNFKFMIDFTKPGGLFGAEDTNSALAYFKRTGDYNRYETLKHWIELVKSLIKDFDYLFLEIDGVQEIATKPNHEFFLGKEKLKITLRETTNMLVQAIINTYRHIAYDTIRNTDVLPINLRRFNAYIVIYPSGYYNMGIYGDEKILPTKRKLSDEFFNINTANEFNHIFIELNDCEIDWDSGSQFFNTISNEPNSDMVKNNLTLTYKFANTSGIFNDTFGSNDFFYILLQASILAKTEQQARMQIISNPTITRPKLNSGSDWLDRAISNTVFGKDSNGKNIFNKYESYLDFSKGGYMDKQLQKMISKTKAKLEDKLTRDIPQKLLGNNSVIGKTLEEFTPDKVFNKLQNTVDNLISRGENWVDSQITKVNNIIIQNFNDDLIELVSNNFGNQFKTKNHIQITNEEPLQHNTSNKTEIINNARPDHYVYNDSDEYTPIPYERPNTLMIQEDKSKFHSEAPPVQIVNENIYSRRGF